MLQMYSVVVRQSCILQSAPRYSRYALGHMHSHYGITDYIPYAVVYIPMTVL